MMEATKLVKQDDFGIPGVGKESPWRLVWRDLENGVEWARQLSNQLIIPYARSIMDTLPMCKGKLVCLFFVSI